MGACSNSGNNKELATKQYGLSNLTLFGLNFRQTAFALGLFVFIGQIFFNQLNHFLVGNARGAVLDIVLVGDPSHDFDELGFFQSVLAAKPEEIIDPQSYAIGAGFVGYFNCGRTLEQFARIEDVVDFLFAEQAVGVDAGFGFVKVVADERRA